MNELTHKLHQISIQSPTKLDADLSREILSACNEVIAIFARNNKRLLLLSGIIHEGKLTLTAKGCDDKTPQSIALRFLEHLDSPSE